MFSNIIGSRVGLLHRGEKLGGMGGEESSKVVDEVNGPTKEGPFALIWADQRMSILRAFLFVWGDASGHLTQQDCQVS